jgi:hypothetical protein
VTYSTPISHMPPSEASSRYRRAQLLVQAARSTRLMAFDTILRLGIKATFWFETDALGISSSVLTSKGAKSSAVMRCPGCPLTSSGLAAQYDSMSFSRNVDCSLPAMSKTSSIGPRKICSTSWGDVAPFSPRGSMFRKAVWR